MAKTRLHRRQRKNLMTSPGTLTYVGERKGTNTHIRRIEYNESFVREQEGTADGPIPGSGGGPAPYVTWINVTGIHEPEAIGQIGQLYDLHPLMMESVMNTLQKPKVEIYDDGHLFVTLKMLHFHSSGSGELWAEHISFVLGENYLLSFQEEQSGDVLLPVVQRLRETVGKTRRSGADYLLYSLIDIIVDHYFVVLEHFGKQLDALEDKVIADSRDQSLAEMYSFKRELTYARRLIWPVRDIVGQLVRADDPLVSKRVFPFLRDVNDHVLQIIENLDAYRELLASLVDVHLTTVSNRMNSVMKTLTIFSAIFMPITFIAGVYGMNFKYIPELNTRYGYFATWGVMIAISLALLAYFRAKRWM